MWRRKIKNKYGEIERITTPSLIHYKPCDTDSSIKYEVEYLRQDLAEAEANANKAGSSVDPWELRDVYETDSLGLAIKEFMIRLFDTNTVNTWFYMTAGDKEICADIPNDLRTIIEILVNSDMKIYNDNLVETNHNLESELKLYKEFVNKYNADNLFKDFIREKYNANEHD